MKAMKFDYSGFICPQCRSTEIEAVGDPTFSPASKDEDGSYPDTWYQVFTHHACEKINPITGFTRWTYNVTDRKK